ncbi:GNAT family N-acetyltransferase [Streptomyces sp. NPDC097619]|uniref:GNAT family N-acetyltransferase n=1 Tax=Streptomyces sp. NPDC097619 TaxID=3157228 RepID=UPI00332BC02E
MSTGLVFRHYGREHSPDLRWQLLDVHAEVHAHGAGGGGTGGTSAGQAGGSGTGEPGAEDPFGAVERYARTLDARMARPGWSCVIAYDGEEPVGYAHGAPLPAGDPWWRGLLSNVPAALAEEPGGRTYVLDELVVRAAWRRFGTGRLLHDALLDVRNEERATLLVDQARPLMRALYESWGWTTLGEHRAWTPGAPLAHALLLPLPLAERAPTPDQAPAPTPAG